METNEQVNLSTNMSLNEVQPINEWFNYIMLMRNIFVPILVCVGIFGNTLCLFVFSAKSMKKSSSSVFLASLAVVDNTFLLCLLVTWIDGQIYVILTVDLACQILIFATYVASSLSVWFIVCFTCERFVAICFPMKNTYMCSIRREKRTVVILTVIACTLYHFSFWTTGMEKFGPQMRCAHKQAYINFLHTVTWIDTVLTMIIPFILIVFMNSMVLRRVLNCHARSKGEKERNRTIVFKTLITSMHKKVIIQKQRPLRFTRIQHVNPQIRVTRTLLFVSTTFLVLNLPSHSIRLYNLITYVSSGNRTISVQFSFLQELTLMFYYLTFSCNFFLYTCFGYNFRKSLSHILHCRSTKEHRRRIVLHRLSSTQGTCHSNML